jgi:hypothetical protein
MCRDLYELLHDAAIQALIESEHPTDTLISRCARIPLLEESRHPAQSRRGFLVSDSWAGMPAVAIRDAATGLERRLRLSCEDLILDVVAERRPKGWDFFARVYERGQVVSRSYVLQVGRRKLVAGSRDIYAWDSPHPPRKIRLLSGEVEVDFDDIPWKAAE